MCRKMHTADDHGGGVVKQDETRNKNWLHIVCTTKMALHSVFSQVDY